MTKNKSNGMTKKKIIGRIIALVLLVAVAFGGYYVYSLFSFMHSINNNNKYQGAPLNTPTWDGTSQVNILLMGVDARGNDPHPRSDSMLLVSINPNTKKVALFSVMRDSYVTIPGYGQSKINAAFANGGPSLAMQTISKFLNVPIQYYAVTDFEGFAKIVDTVGGIDVNIPQPMVHPDVGEYNINLPAGKQHLNGHEALEYVRYRGTPRADFDRTERQRAVIKQVAEKLKSPANVLKLPTLLKDIEPYTQTNLSPSDLLKLTSLGMQLDAQGMQTEQIPPDQYLSEGWDDAGEEVLIPDIPNTQKFVQQILQSQGSASGTQGSNANTTPPAQASGNGSTTDTNSDNNASNQSTTGNGNLPTATVTGGDTVNIRQKPGTEYPVIGQLDSGATVTIEEQDGDWDYIQTQDGMDGYVAASLLTVQ